jgi:ATP-dependent 26S proteasome regulatory subunit
MSHEDPGDITYSDVGGLSEQIRELREVQLILTCTIVDKQSIVFISK